MYLFQSANQCRRVTPRRDGLWDAPLGESFFLAVAVAVAVALTLALALALAKAEEGATMVSASQEEAMEGYPQP